MNEAKRAGDLSYATAGSSLNGDEESATNADGMCMAGKTILIPGFEVPAESMFCTSPEHEIQGGLYTY